MLSTFVSVYNLFCILITIFGQERRGDTTYRPLRQDLPARSVNNYSGDVGGDDNYLSVCVRDVSEVKRDLVIHSE